MFKIKDILFKAMGRLVAFDLWLMALPVSTNSRANKCMTKERNTASLPVGCFFVPLLYWSLVMEHHYSLFTVT